MKTTTLCALCGALLTNGSRLCPTDTEALMNEVRNASDLLAELETTLTRQDRVAAATVGGRSSEVPLPYNVGASRATDELRASVRAMARGGIGHDEVRRFRTARSRAMEAIDIPDPRVWVGACTCGRPLYARRGEDVVTCQTCREEWTATPIDAWPEVRRLVGSVSNIRQWLLALGIIRSRAAVYRDVARLEPVDGNLYRFAEVLDGLTDAKLRRKGA